MHILPPLETVKDIAATQQYDVLPLSCEILSDFITPIEAMRRAAYSAEASSVIRMPEIFSASVSFGVMEKSDPSSRDESSEAGAGFRTTFFPSRCAMPATS